MLISNGCRSQRKIKLLIRNITFSLFFSLFFWIILVGYGMFYLKLTKNVWNLNWAIPNVYCLKLGETEGSCQFWTHTHGNRADGWNRDNKRSFIPWIKQTLLQVSVRGCGMITRVKHQVLFSAIHQGANH